jgi:hypothetical protein
MFVSETDLANAITRLETDLFALKTVFKELSALGTKSVYFLEMREVNDYTYNSCTFTFIFLF